MTTKHDYVETWDEDPEGCSGCECGYEDCPCFTGDAHRTLSCYIYRCADIDANNPIVVTSLHGICAPDDAYMREIVEDLIAEAIAIDTRIDTRKESERLTAARAITVMVP